MASIVARDTVPCRRRKSRGKAGKCHLKEKITVCRFTAKATKANRGKFAMHRSCGLKKKGR